MERQEFTDGDRTFIGTGIDEPWKRPEEELVCPKVSLIRWISPPSVK